MNCSGGSALSCAVKGGHAWIAHSLIAAGASVDNKLQDAYTPLMIAAQTGLSFIQTIHIVIIVTAVVVF